MPVSVSRRCAAVDGFRRMSEPPSSVSAPRACTNTVRHDESMNSTPERSRVMTCLGPDVRLDGVAEASGRGDVDLALHVDNRRAVFRDDLGAEQRLVGHHAASCSDGRTA